MPSRAVAAMEIDGAAAGGAEEAQWSSFRRTWREGTGFLVWQDLTAVLPVHSSEQPLKKLLNGLNGYAVPGRILAIMGPSGSGKSTLLDSLAGRLGSNVLLTGNIFLNGRQRRIDYGVIAYVTQENVFLGTLTVRETIAYSAQLRAPEKNVRTLVETTLEEMGLVDCADHPIGNWHLRGISGGEKKRLAIALEVLTGPPFLFLDEPTTGLDSASAYFVALTLRQMAREGRTVVASVHQPSSEVFALFDDLCLLSGGEAVYFGDAKLATEFFAQVGFRCPSRRNPSDHFLRCVNSDFDHVNATLRGSLQLRNRDANAGISSDPLANLSVTEIKAMLINRYKTSDYARTVQERINEISTARSLPVDPVKGSRPGWFKQLVTLTRRSTINMSRDFGYYWLRIAVYIIVSISVGTIFYNIGSSYTSIMARSACGGFISGFMTFMSIGGFPSFIEEMKVFYYERRNGHYGVAVYVLSNFLSSFPFLFVMCLCTAAITYNMAKYRPGFDPWVYSALLLLASIASIESLMMIIAAVVPNFVMGIISGAGVLGIMMMTSGFFRLLRDLPKPVWRYPVSYMSYGSWALKGGYKNDLVGLNFEPLEIGGAVVSGEEALDSLYGIDNTYSKWWDLAAIVFLVLAYRVVFFCLIKFNERVTPVIRQMYNRATVHRLRRRSSFFRETTLISTR